MKSSRFGVKWGVRVGVCVLGFLVAVAVGEQSCKLKAKFNLMGYKNVEKKKVVIGGMFSVHNRLFSTDTNTSSNPVSSGCEGFNFRTFRWTQTMLFAINEINQRTDLLPNTELGYVIYDSCFTISKAVEGTLTFLTGQDEAVPNYRCGNGPPLAAMVGAGGCDLSVATARILGLYYFPQVSYSSSCSVLESRFQYPTFLRTIPSDEHQSVAMAQLVLNFGWTWVGTIASDDDYGKYGIKRFKEVVEEAGVCISFSETLPKFSAPDTIKRIVNTISESTAKIIVVFSSDVDLRPLVEELLLHNITNRTWIASENWITSAIIAQQPEVMSLLGGTIGFAITRANIPGLREHLLNIDPYQDSLTEEFWESAFNCTLSYSRALDNTRAQLATQVGNATASRVAARLAPQGLCTGKESLQILNNTYSDVSQLRLTYNVYKSVYAVAYALHNLEYCEPGKGPFVGGSCADITNFEPWQLMYYLKNLRFTVPYTGEEISFNDGEVAGFYEILNWQRASDGGVAYKHARGCIQCTEDYWSNANRDACVPKTIEFLDFGEALGITLIVISVFGALLTVVVAIVHLKYLNTPLVQANDALLSFTLLLGLVVTFLCSIVFLGRPQLWSCMTSQVALALGFALALSSLMGKSSLLMLRARAIKIMKTAAKAAKAAAAASEQSGDTAAIAPAIPQKNDIDPIKPPQQRTMMIVCTLIQAIACTVWLILLPPHPVKNTAAQNIKIILECDPGNIIFICCIFGYDVLLALMAFVFAFVARKLEDNFSEGKCITFGMLVFFIVWISFVPAYLSTRGKFMVAVQIFAILASSFGLLACVFLPKCYVLLVKPDRNKEELLVTRAKRPEPGTTGTSASTDTNGPISTIEG
ncbi:Extracellular calcium-sensing receptor [Bagarius yarrelli]|uniref:Extracellular calcium-sensing receptor n=1 Tax=Bagarius yarrelli TaxID=175774 RepID=A0A556TQM7_BAGYA|nr:Extracellular calcium-sensing receptor [Bagarius yarrelli]